MKILLFFILVVLVFSKTAPMAVTPNEKYTRTGKHIINSNALNHQYSAITFTMPFNRQFQDIPGIALLSIDSIQFHIVNNLIDFDIRIIKVGNSEINTQVESSCLQRIMQMSLRYYVAVDSYADLSIFEAIASYKHPVTQDITQNSSYEVSVPSNLNSSNVGDFSFITGINATSLDNFFDVKLLILDQSGSSSNGGMIATIGSDNPAPTYVRTISWNLLVFDKTKANNPKFGLFSVVNMTSYTTTDIPNVYLDSVRTYNTIVGINQISVANLSTFSLNIDVDKNSLNFGGTTNSSFTIMTVDTYYCGQDTPFLMEKQNECYDSCPFFYFQDEKSLMCLLSLMIIAIISSVGGLPILIIAVAVWIKVRKSQSLREQVYTSTNQSSLVAAREERWGIQSEQIQIVVNQSQLNNYNQTQSDDERYDRIRDQSGSICGEKVDVISQDKIKEVPYRHIGVIIAKGINGMKQLGTGILISKNIVLTCAHIIYCKQFGNNEFTSIYFYPGQYGDVTNGFEVESQATPEEYKSKKWWQNKKYFDYILLKLKEDVNETEFLSLCGDFSELNHQTTLMIKHTHPKLKSLTHGAFLTGKKAAEAVAFLIKNDH